ncbi:MAG: hypothetical protein ACT4OM_05870 [Actinomycetota bacterium]
MSAVVFRRHLLLGYTFPWDFTATTRWAVFVTSTVGSGHFTEWVPFVGGGFPVAECAGCGLYSPLWWAMGLLGVPATVGVLTALQAAHVAFGAIGVFAFARRFVPAWQWALLAGVAYLFFGGFYGNASHDVILRGHAYAPWLLWIITLPESGRPGKRFFLLPLWAWAMTTMAYPGQTIGFLLVASVYLAAQLWSNPESIRRALPVMAPALFASAAIIVAAYLPYAAADRAGRLFRPFPPAALERAAWALHPADLWGLYLNPFARSEVTATITSGAVGAVILIGVAALVRKRRPSDKKASAPLATTSNREAAPQRRRSPPATSLEPEARGIAPLVAVGGTALALAMLPAWAPAGRLMAAIPLLFPSRLPASDYKALVAVSLVCLGSIGWSRLAAGERFGIAPAIAGTVLLAGPAVAPTSREVALARAPLLVVAIVVASLMIARFGTRIPARLTFGALLLLVVVEGTRVISDLQIYPEQTSWAVTSGAFPDRQLHDRQASALRHQLADPPPTRPGRTAVLAPYNPVGSTDDAIGYLGTSYRLGDYGGTISAARHRITESPKLTKIMLRPWTAWVIPCSQIDCSATALGLPYDMDSHLSASVETIAYGMDRIEYRVDLPEASLLIENELAAPGWSSTQPGIAQVEIAGALRGWTVPAGRYNFATTYRQPERSAQLVVVALGLAAMTPSVISLLLPKAWQISWKQRSKRKVRDESN